MKFIRCYLLSISIGFYYISTVVALTLEESISLAVQNSTELKLERQKQELVGTAKLDAMTMFLPNIEAGYRGGTRETSITTLPDRNLPEDVRTLTFTQPIFDGFQGVSKMEEASHKINAAQENLNIKTNAIVLSVIDSYLNILNLRQMTTLQSESIEDYNKILKLANQKFSLSDISYSELSEYEINSRKILLKHNNDSIKLEENELKFANLTGLRPNNLLDIKALDNIAGPEVLFKIAESKNPNIKMADAEFKAAGSAANAEKGKFSPKVSLVFQLEDQKSSYYYDGQRVTNKAIYIKVSIPLFQSGAEIAGVLKANMQKQVANWERVLARQKVEMALKEEYHKYISFHKTLDLLKKTAANVEKSLKLAEERFKKRDISKLEFLLTKVDANDIKMQISNAKYEASLSYYRIKALISELLEVKDIRR